MVTIEQAKNGVRSYIMTEIVPKLGGWQKWVAGAFATLAVDRAEQLVSNPAVKMLGIVTNDGMIDIDALYHAFITQANEPVTIDIPAIGTITLRADDIDLMMQHIRQGG